MRPSGGGGATIGPVRHRMEGIIAAAGFASGDRVVVGHWAAGPLGPMSDVMWAAPDGTRTLFAPSAGRGHVHHRRLRLRRGGRRPAAGRGRRPGHRRRDRRTATPIRADARPTDDLAPIGLRMADPTAPPTAGAHPVRRGPIARALMGVRTYGVSPRGVREWYQASEWRPLASASATIDGTSLGSMRPIEPPCGFGFSEPPRRPSLTVVRPLLEDPTGRLDAVLADLAHRPSSRPRPRTSAPVTRRVAVPQSLTHPTRGPGLTERGRSAEAAHVDVDDQAEGDEGHDRRRAAVAHEGQGDAGDRHDPHRHPDVLEDLEHEQGQHAHADHGAGVVAGELGRAPDAPHHERVHADEEAGAGQAELLPHRGEDEVGVLLGHVAQPGLRALEQPLALDAAGADGDLRLLEVPRRAADLLLGLGPLLAGEDREPVLLVVVEHAARQHERREEHRPHPEQHQVLAPAPPPRPAG